MRIAFWSALVVAFALGTSSAIPPLAAQAGNRERTLYVSAVDKDGEPVEGLGPEAFLVQEGGRRREVLRVSRAVEPIELALLIDNSDAASAGITFLREALLKFVDVMGDRHHIALIGLADRPTVIVQYTSDTAQLKAVAKGLFTRPGTGATLLDALWETSRGLRRREGPRAVVMAVVTDGPEFTNRYSDDIVRELRGSGASLHVIGLGRFPYADAHPIRERAFVIDDGPKATGGQRVLLLAPHALPATMERFARELSAQYKVVYGRPDSLYEENVEVKSAKAGITMRGTPERAATGATK